MNQPLDPSQILQTATAFFASKTLLSAVELDLFSELGEKRLSARDLGERLGLHRRGRFDFLDALVALGFLHREGEGADGLYSNTLETAAFLDLGSKTYIGGMAKMLNSRLFGFWNDLTTALRTGEPQNEIKGTGESLFVSLYSDPERLEQFLHAMSGLQAASFEALARTFDFSRFRTLTDAGGALGTLSCIVAAHHPHLRCTTFDLPPVKPHAEKAILAAGLSNRVTAASGDFLQDDLPKADVVTMGNILHDWNLEEKKMLIRKAYEALPEGGAFVAIENIIDDARRENAFGLLMSLNMLIETEGGFDYTGADFRAWCGDVGFKRFEAIPLTGPTSAAIAFK